MAIWNCTDDNNDIARLLRMALPNVDEDEEILALEPGRLHAVEQMAESLLDPYLAHVAALADLIGNADSATLGKRTIQDAGLLLSTLTQLQEIVRRIASNAGSYRDPEMRAFYQGAKRGDKVEVARLVQ